MINAKKVKQELLNEIETGICKNTLFMNFFKRTANEETDKEAKAKIMVKVDQIQTDIDNNKKMVEFLKDA